MVLVSHGWGRMLNLSLAETLGLTENRQMLIQCPDCAAAFEVPERLLADPSRPLRCSQCRTVFPIPESAAPKTKGWRDPEPIAPPPPAPPPPPPPAKAEESPAGKAPAPDLPNEPLVAPDSAPEPAKDKASSRSLRAAWAASILVLILGGVGAVAQRAEIMEVWPPSARLFAALGLG
jgi:predicted Zn finger-like uncharacterized protein